MKHFLEAFSDFRQANQRHVPRAAIVDSRHPHEALTNNPLVLRETRTGFGVVELIALHVKICR